MTLLLVSKRLDTRAPALPAGIPSTSDTLSPSRNRAEALGRIISCLLPWRMVLFLPLLAFISCMTPAGKTHKSDSLTSLGDGFNEHGLTTTVPVSWLIAKRCVAWLLYEDWGPGQEPPPIEARLVRRLRNLRVRTLVNGGKLLAVSVKSEDSAPEHYAYAVLEKKLFGPAEPFGAGTPRDRWLYINILDHDPLRRHVDVVVGGSSQSISLEVSVRNGVCTVTRLAEIYHYD